MLHYKKWGFLRLIAAGLMMVIVCPTTLELVTHEHIRMHAKPDCVCWFYQANTSARCGND